MKKVFISFVIIAICLFSLSSCITMLLLNQSIKDKAYDERGCSNSVFSVAKGKTVRFTRANIYGSNNDPKKHSKRYGEEKLGTGWYFGSNCFDCDGFNSSERYQFGECDSVRIKYGGEVVSGYRLLTTEEWHYLLFERDASTIGGVENARFVVGKVGLKHGLILFPDNYKHPRGVPEIFGANDGSGFSSDNSFKDTEWEKMENAGAVFLIEPCFGGSCPLGYLTTSKNNNGEVGFMCFSTVTFHYVDIRWLPDNIKGLGRLVSDN